MSFSVLTAGLVFSSVDSVTAAFSSGFAAGVNTFLAGALLVAGFGEVAAAVFITAFAGVFAVEVVAVFVTVAAGALAVAGFAAVVFGAAGFVAAVLAGAVLRTGAFADGVLAVFSVAGFVVSTAGESIFSGVVSSVLFSI
ncbi:hypothetical protein [Flavobacterium resistens]|uniref:hypothetical protein n=1 Tax=Flavobacterium resistens TaxID=443612 RepID=UPI001FCC89E2|nr:hypothetical protein [Flavobacterium resistens]